MSHLSPTRPHYESLGGESNCFMSLQSGIIWLVVSWDYCRYGNITVWRSNACFADAPDTDSKRVAFLMFRDHVFRKIRSIGQ